MAVLLAVADPATIAPVAAALPDGEFFTARGPLSV
jgi:hypothetical protein